MQDSMESRLGGRRAELQRMRQATEDDLLADQQAFLAQPKQPAAKVIRATRSSATAAHSSQPPLSAFKREQMAQQAAAAVGSPSSTSARPTPAVVRASAALPSFEDEEDDEEDDGDDYSAPRMVAPAVLSDIVERDSSSHSALPPSAQHIPLGSVHKGFPATFRVTSTPLPPPSASTNQTVKKSLFALQREQERQKQQTQPAVQPIQPKAIVSGAVMAAQPVQESREPEVESQWRNIAKAKAAETTDDRQRISAENEQKIAGMSADEIEEAQRELQASLPPALIARLMQSRANQSTASPTNLPPTIDRLFGQLSTQADDNDQSAVVEQPQPPAAALTTPVDSFASSSSPLSRAIPVNPSPVPYPQSAKTEWMAPVPSPTAPPQWQQLTWHTGLTASTSDSTSGSDAASGGEVGTAWQYWRLDFKGRWIDERHQSSSAAAAAEEDRYDGLYHHGQHAERAGYSLDEIIYLCHSTLPAQRQLMLELLTRTLAHVNTAHYVMPQPVSDGRLLSVDFNALVLERLQVLNVVTVLRVAMDDAAVGIVAAAVRGVEALLYRRIEEERRRQRRLAWRGQWLLPAGLSQQALDAWDKPFRPAAVESVVAEVEEASKGRLAEEDVRDNSDDETVCRRDVVVGLVRMQLLPRLRFLLDVHSTPTDTSQSATATDTRVFSPLVNSIVHILLLIAQHSAPATEAVTTTPHLLPILSSLTLSLPQSSAANPHLLPLLSLLSTSTAVVQHLTATGALLHCHSYMLVANGLPGSIPPQPSAAAFTLSRDALHLWSTTLQHTRTVDGLDVAAEEEFTTFFPVLMQILVRRHTAAGATAEHKEEVKQAVEEGTEEGWEREETEQVRAAYNVLEALCGCIGKTEAKRDNDDESSSISVTHLVSSVDYAIAQFTTSFLSHLPTTLQTQHVSCMAGMAHFAACYYEQLPTSAAFSAASSSQQLDRQWSTVWDKWSDSGVIADVVTQLCSADAVSAVQSSYSSAIFCFPSTSLSVPGLPYVDLLVAVCRWLLASVALVVDRRAVACERLRESDVLRSLVRVSTSLCDWPVVDAHTALLLYHIVMLYHQSASDFSLGVYRAAMVAVCPLLTAGYRSEVDELLRTVLLGEQSLTAMRTMREATWTRGRNGLPVCGVCEWSSRDVLSVSTLRDTLLPAIQAALNLHGAQQQPEDASLVQHSVASSVTVSLYDNNSTWPLLLSRNLLLLTSLPRIASASASQPTFILRSYLHYLSLLIDCHLWSTSNDRTTAARSLMELLVRSPDCTTEPSLSLPLTHCTHSLHSGADWQFSTVWLNRLRSGWGSNVFMFASELVELYVGEAVGEEVWSEVVLMLVRRELVRDYRLLVYSRCMEVDVTVRSNWPGWPGVLWPREDSSEVLAVYREYVGKRRRGGAGGGGGEGGVLCEVAMHHLLCDCLGEEVVRENRQVVGKESKIRQRMGHGVDEGVIHALMNYRYMH